MRRQGHARAREGLHTHTHVYWLGGRGSIPSFFCRRSDPFFSYTCGQRGAAKPNSSHSVIPQELRLEYIAPQPRLCRTGTSGPVPGGRPCSSWRQSRDCDPGLPDADWVITRLRLAYSLTATVYPEVYPSDMLAILARLEPSHECHMHDSFDQ